MLEFEEFIKNKKAHYQTFEQKRQMKWERDYWINQAMDRLRRYEDTRNMEHLVDAANMCLLEFEFGEHPKKHFESLDDGKHSPR